MIKIICKLINSKNNINNYSKHMEKDMLLGYNIKYN